MNTTGFVEEIIDIGSISDPISVPITFDFVLPRTQGFVVIDFNDEVVFPECDWASGTCDSFDPSAIRACIRLNGFTAGLGCI